LIQLTAKAACRACLTLDAAPNVKDGHRKTIAVVFGLVFGIVFGVHAVTLRTREKELAMVNATGPGWKRVPAAAETPGKRASRRQPAVNDPVSVPVSAHA
jgi:hypothetical protein